ncbi:MAG: hypothetical protein ACFFAU_15595 [Candidatus Hodarchaeota archaeon]
MKSKPLKKHACGWCRAPTTRERRYYGKLYYYCTTQCELKGQSTKNIIMGPVFCLIAFGPVPFYSVINPPNLLGISIILWMIGWISVGICVIIVGLVGWLLIFIPEFFRERRETAVKKVIENFDWELGQNNE